MRGSFPSNFWLRSLLSLFLLTASIGAPFRSHTLGRVFLHGLRHDVASSSVIRVRAVSGGDVSHGFRAVVGFSKGGPDEADPGTNSHAVLASLPSPTSTLPCRHGSHPLARMTPPLRC